MNLQSVSEKKLFYTLGFLSFGLFSFLSFNNFISHSEFWSIASAKLFGASSGEASVVYYKSLFYLFLKPFFWLPLDNSQHILAARLLFGWLAFANFFIFLRTLKKIMPSRSDIVFFGLFLLTFQIYFYNIYRVRADFLAHFFILLAYLKITENHISKKGLNNTGLPLFILFGLAFLSTPKAIYSIINLSLYALFLNVKKEKPFSLFKHLCLFMLLPLGLILVFSHWLSSFFSFYEAPYSMALSYHFQSLKRLFQANHWLHIFDSLKINFFHYLFILFGSLTFIRQKEKTLIIKAQFLLALLFLVSTLIHPEKWPYFLAQMIPFISLPALLSLEKIKTPLVKAGLILILLLAPFIITKPSTWFRSNHQQIEVIKSLEYVFKSIPQAQYFDSTGLLPRESGLMNFMDSHNQSAREFALQMVEAKMPEFIFYTPKVHLANPEILVFLGNEYENISDDLWVRRDQFLLIRNETFDAHFPLQKIFGYDYLPVFRF